VSDLFGRVATVQLNTLKVDGLRIAFRVDRDLSKTPNNTEIQIWNLSEESRKKAQVKNGQVTLEAGYGKNYSVIFDGDVRHVEHRHEGPDWITKIEAGDGELALRTKRVSKSWKAGTPIADVLKFLADQSGLKLGNSAQAFASGSFAGGLRQFANGCSVSGPAGLELERLVSSFGLTLSVQDGAIQILETQGVTKDPVVFLSARTGLVGSPEVGEIRQDKKATLKIKALLQPLVRPGRRVELESRSFTGLYRVERVVHSGDTHNQEFYSELYATAL
jgi:hypothetical protein